MMALRNLMRLLVVLLTSLNCESFFPGFETSFDFSKLKGPVPTDPDVYRNVSQLIQSKGYPVEEHHVTTPDGYILSLQRIPHGRKTEEKNKKPVVLLQHGLLADSSCWVLNFPHNSLAFILADHGFDVWLSNSRGNRYSRKNKYVSPYSTKFWKWSFDSMAKYDIPSTIDHILNKTNQAQLYYIGHSQGTLIAFTSLSTQRELAKKVKLFIALAPIVTIGNLNVEYLRTLAKIVTTLELFVPIIDSPFLPGTIWRKKFIEKGFCNGLTEEKLCYKLYESVFGEDDANMNFSRISVFFSNFPSGSSLRNLIHFAQLVVSGKCQHFDYGPLENFIHYGQRKPPLYPIEDIETPIVLVSGTHDTLSDPRDVKLLVPRIKNLVLNKVIQDWNHFDFFDGNDANVQLYPEIIKILEKYTAI